MSEAVSPFKQNLSQAMIVNFVWNVVGNGVVFLVTMLATPYILRKLTIDLYGVYTLLGVVTGYVSILQFGIGMSSVKYLSEHIGQKDDLQIRRTFWTSLFAYAAIGSIGASIIYLSASVVVGTFFRITGEYGAIAVTLLKISSASFFLSMLVSATGNAIQSLSRFDILNRVAILLGIVQVGLIVMLLKMGHSLVAIVVAMIGVQVLNLFIYAVVTKRLLPRLSKPLVSMRVLLKLFKFGGFITISSTIGLIMTNMEKFFLTALQSLAALTYYTVPANLVSKLSILPSSLSGVIFPVFSRLDAARQEKVNQELNYRSTLYSFFMYVFFALLLVIFGKQFLVFWLGKEFAQNAFGILAILAIAGLLAATSLPSLMVLQSTGRPQVSAFLHSIELVLYLPAAYILIKKMGGTGAAIAWLLRIALDAVFLHSASCAVFGENLLAWYGRLLFRGLPPVMVTGLLLWGVSRLHIHFLSPGNLVMVCLISLLYVFLVWTWGFDSFARRNMADFIKDMVKPRA